MNPNVFSRAAGTLAVAALSSSALASVSPLSNWNLICRTDVNSSSEVDGSSLIGGNLLGNSTNYAVQGFTASSGVGLAVGGNVSGGPKQVNSGTFRYNGTLNTIVNVASNNSAVDPTIPAQVASALSWADSFSSHLLTLTPNGTIDGAGNMNASPVLIGSERVAIYSFNIASITSLGQLNLNFGSADSVVLNVASNLGTVNLQAPPNLLGGFSQPNSSRIIWNFFDATLVTTNNTFNGALLAPDADLQILGGGVNGSVVVNSISLQQAEIRRFTYTGYVPTPGAAALAALAGLAASRRRR